MKTTGNGAQPLNSLSYARAYQKRGWKLVLLQPRSKKPVHDGWTNRFYDPGSLEREFLDGQNLGVLLGEPSGGLADVDLDSAEAIILAPAFLPPTGAVFGHRSKPRSHWLYQVTPTNFRTTQYKDRACKEESQAMLVELRGGGGQTMMPPSIHPSGELVTWESEGPPAQIAYHVLAAAVAKLAAAALLARHWPAKGLRHEATLALAGALL